MSIKSFFRKVIPAYRAKDAIEKDLHHYYTKLMNRIELLEQKNEYLFFCLQHLAGETDLETKKRVYRSFPKASGQVADCQLAANYILSGVKRICDENGISFALCGGTLLGAVRHEGFIPWDDDVDIDIMRSDFYRLQELLRDNDELVMKRYYKYRNGGKEAGHLTRIKLKQSDRYFIDVFPLDYMSIEEGWEESKYERKEAFCEEYSQKLKEIFNRHGFRYQGTERAVAVPEMDDEVDALEAEYLSKYESEFVDNKKYTHFTRGIGVGRWLRDIYRIQRVDKYLPFEHDVVLFEGNRYGAFRNYSDLLRYQYGDYWALPNKMNQSHNYEYDSYSEEDIALIDEIRKKQNDRVQNETMK